MRATKSMRSTKYRKTDGVPSCQASWPGVAELPAPREDVLWPRQGCAPGAAMPCPYEGNGDGCGRGQGAWRSTPALRTPENNPHEGVRLDALAVGHDYAAAAAWARGDVANFTCGSLYADRHIRGSFRIDHWELPERLHRADTGTEVHRDAGVGVPEMRRGDSPLGQHSGGELAAARREMPLVQDENLADVSDRSSC